MQQGRILVALSSFCEHNEVPRDLLSQSGIPFVEHKTGKRITPEELFAMGSDWCGIVAGVESYSAATLARLPSLRCISRVGVGIDAIDLAAAKERGIAVRNTPDAPTAAVAEMAIAQILDLLHLTAWHDRQLKQRKWIKKTGHQLFGNTVGIIGVGRIGRAVAERLRPFGVKLLGTDVCEDAAWAETIGLQYVPLDVLLRKSDVITLHAAAKSEKPLLGIREFELMKDGAVLVNTSRGGLIDTVALQQRLASGKLFGAGLDVFPKEPYDGPLCDFENALLTPHICTLTVETRIRMETEAVQNLLEELEK